MRANADWNMNPVAFVDDDPMKARKWIVGVPVRGALDELEVIIRRHEVDEVILSSPAINGRVEHRIRQICNGMDLQVRRFHMEIR
jgi:FlaA1/EpsC-like NDP-sugar epimerase